MEILNSIINLMASLAFIGLVHHLLISVIDWNKIITVSPDNVSKLKLLILFFSIAIGYLVSRFVIDVISLSETLFFNFR